MGTVLPHREGRVFLSDLGEFIKGRDITRADLVQSGIPCLRYGDLYTTYGDVTDELTSFVSEDTARRATPLHHGDIIFAASGETAGEIGKAVAWLGNGTAVAGGDTIILRGHGQDPTFLAHALNADDAVRQKSRLGKGHSVVHIHEAELAKVSVFLPPISDQRKIGEILRTWDDAAKKLGVLRTEKERLLRRFYSVVFQPGSPINRFWAEYRIGEFLIPRVEYALPKANLPLYSLTIEDGVTPKTERYNRDFLVKDHNSKTYKIVHPGDIVFNPSNLRWGAIARSDVNHDVLLSPIYEVLEVSSDKINADYLTHALTCPFQIRRFATKVEGTLLERMAVKLNAFLMSKIVVSTDKQEQAGFSNLLNSMQEEIQFLLEQFSTVVLQKRGLLQKLLSGNGRLDSIDTRLPVIR
ncbi:MAG: restriction endonuclease subunit S [Gemmatimonadetes bacterium]|nr:restriction endonuclease subunit S [Gemmatimonadota bacterium]